jgi:uncharacterized protein
MSAETLELARQVMETLSQRDIERLVALADPEVEWHSLFAELGEGGVYRGHEGTRKFIRDISEAWEIVRADVDDALAVNEVALLVGRIHYRGRGSGVEAELPTGWTLRFRDRKVVCFRAFRQPDKALETLGLR